MTQKNDIKQSIKEEINSLKEEIVNLEEKLNKSENRKERLKIKLIQRRRLTHIGNNLSRFYSKQNEEKYIILSIIIVVFIVFIVILNFKPKTPRPAIEKTRQEFGRPEKKPVKIAPAQNNSSTGKFTLQVAEYADAPSARRFVEDMEELGYFVTVNTIYRKKNQKNPYFKVDVGLFDSIQEANAFKKVFRKKTKINDAFVKERK